MSTVFRTGDVVEVKSITHGAPIETLGMQGTIRSIYEWGDKNVGIVVEFPNETYWCNRWDYDSDELELVQEVPHGHT